MNITLNSGIDIKLYALLQKLTYEGLIEGVPTKRMNSSLINNMLNKHRYHDTLPYLIEPTETPLDLGRDYPFGDPASIPGIVCIARFESDYTSKEPILFRTTAKVVWFQSDFALPIESSCLDQIKAIDWPQIAVEYGV